MLEEGQPWTPKQIQALIEDRYNVTYHPSHLSRKLREAGMNYAKPDRWIHDDPTMLTRFSPSALIGRSARIPGAG